MTITELNEENSSGYAELIPAELLTDLSREYMRGMVVEDTDGPGAAIIWKIKNAELDDVPTEAEILLFSVPEISGAAELLKAFGQSVRDEGALKVTFELGKVGSLEKSLLEESGFGLTEAESIDLIVSIGELSALNLGKKKIPPYIVSLSEISSRQFKAGIMAGVFQGKYGILEDLPFLPKDRYEPSISSCVITDDKVNGFLLVHKTLAGIFFVELFFATQPDANINLLNMMRYSIRTAAKLCDENDKVVLRRHNKASVELVKKLFPNKKGPTVMRGQKVF